jgi:phosphatidylglycerol---prolipoprotein diacylglyceryl transferase
MLSVLASIPSPSSNAIHIGGLQLRAYGLMIAMGVVAAVWLANKRWVAAGGDPDDMSAIALVAVPAGVVGARLYHVMTDWRRFTHQPIKALYIWQGGLGIWGAIALGSLGALWVARRRGLPIGPLADACAPALPLAQAFGRLGNWFNQELFGKPTTLPWALKIDLAHRPPGFEQYETFHPTFLYEGLWCLVLCIALIAIGKRFGSRLRAGSLFWLYVAGYTFVRFFIERIRIDFASRLWGLRINEWVSAVVFLIAVGILVLLNIHEPSEAPDDGSATVGAEEATAH